MRDIITIVILILFILGQEGTIPTDKPKHPEITVVASTDQKEAIVGEPVLIGVIVNNETDREFRLDEKMFQNHADSGNHLEIAKGSGEYATYTLDMEGLWDRYSPHRYLPLKSGESLVIQDLIVCQGRRPRYINDQEMKGGGHPLREPGEYRIRYRLSYFDPTLKTHRNAVSKDVTIMVREPEGVDKALSETLVDPEYLHWTKFMNFFGAMRLEDQQRNKMSPKEIAEELKTVIEKHKESRLAKYLKYYRACNLDEDFRYQERNLQYVSRNVSKDALEVLWDIVKNEKEFCLTIQCWKDLLMLYQQTGDTKKCEEIQKYLQEKYKDHPSLNAQHAYWMLGQFPRVPEPVPPLIEGKVVSYDSEQKIVTLDIGEEQGVKVGMSYIIYRSGTPGTFVARVTIKSVERTKSTGKIEIESLQPKAGDRCANRLKMK